MNRLESQHKDLGKMLLDEGLITEEQLATARAAQLTREKSIGQILVDLGIITEDAKMAFLNKKLRYEIVDIRGIQIPQNVLGKLTLSYAEKYCCVPLLIENGRLVIAMEDPTNLMVIDEIKNQSGMEVMPVVAPQGDIQLAIEQYPHLTQAQADAIVRNVQQPLWLRILHPLLFLLILISPLIAFCIAVLVNNQFGNHLSNLGKPFDIGLYLALSWSLWAIVIWEVDGLFFSPKSASAD